MVIRSIAVLAATLILRSSAFAQAAPAADPQTETAPAPPPGATVLQANTRIVILDVVVQDGAGKPIHGLKASNFKVTEAKTLQQLRNVDEHIPTPLTTRGPELGPMPPGTFTDYTPVAPNDTLNILLLDALNTPTKDQGYVRDQLQQYVKNAKPAPASPSSAWLTASSSCRASPPTPKPSKTRSTTSSSPAAPVCSTTPPAPASTRSRAPTSSTPPPSPPPPTGPSSSSPPTSSSLKPKPPRSKPSSAPSTPSTPSTPSPTTSAPSPAAKTSSGSPAPSPSISSPTAASKTASPS
jgi:hypothetical protein